MERDKRAASLDSKWRRCLLFRLTRLCTSTSSGAADVWEFLPLEGDCLGVATVNRRLQRCKLAATAFCRRVTCYEMSCQSRDRRGSFDGPIDEELTARGGGETAPILESCRRRRIRFLPIDSLCSGAIRNVFLVKLDIYSENRWCIKAKRETRKLKAFIKDL